MDTLTHSEYAAVKLRTDELKKLGWRHSYPTLSSLLSGMECEAVQNLILDKQEPSKHPLGKLRALWQSVGRPQLEWKVCDEWNVLRSIRKVLAICFSWRAIRCPNEKS